MAEGSKKGTGRASTRAQRTIRNSGVPTRIRRVVGRR